MKILSIFFAAALVKGCIKMADNGAAAAAKGVDNAVGKGIERGANSGAKGLENNFVSGMENGAVKAGAKGAYRLTHEDSAKIKKEATLQTKEWIENLSLKEVFKYNLETLETMERTLDIKPNSGNVEELSQISNDMFDYVDDLVMAFSNKKQFPVVPKALLELRDKLSRKNKEIEDFKKVHP